MWVKFMIKKDKNFHRFALSAIREELLEREREKKSFGVLYRVTYYP